MTDQAGPVPPPDPEVVHGLCQEAYALVSRLPGAVGRVRVEAAGYVVEVEWDATGTGAASVQAHPQVPGAATEEQLTAERPPDRHPIVAPLVGTFYRGAEPGARPFVEKGDLVDSGQTVGIVEAMKLMNHIVADRAGRVAEIVVPDGEMVEFEEVLMYLEGTRTA